MAPHRQRRITILIAAFALQIPTLILLWALGFEPSSSGLVPLIPALALGWFLISKNNNP